MGKSGETEEWSKVRLSSEDTSKGNDNEIITARYTFLTFLPKAIIEQFRKKSNFFFLSMVILQLVAPVPTDPSLYILTFCLILSVSISKSGYEDWLRHRADNRVNTTPVHLFKRHSITVVTSRSLHVGQVIRLQENEDVPADILLLSSVSPAGHFVHKSDITTANLDGEPNLKLRICTVRYPPLKDHDPTVLRETLFQNEVIVEYESPKADLYKFNGTLTADTPAHKAPLTLTMENILLRGTTVKNSQFVYGLVIYTGKNTRLSLNTSAPRLGKFSLVDSAINRMIAGMAVVLMSLTLIGLLGGIMWHRNVEPDSWYLPPFEGSEILLGFTTAFIFIVLFSAVIPISLSVTVEIQKLFSSLFFGWDTEMHCLASGRAPLCNNSDVVEELGQIEYLLTDKTGTLTENNLNFVSCSIGGKMYAYKRNQNGHFRLIPPPETDTNDNQSVTDVDEFLRALALCHNVQAVVSNGHLSYQGISSDEEALVTAAHELDVTLCGEDANGYTILEQNGIQTKFTRHLTFEFDSDRKCMSVVVEDADGRFFLICKGAESAILPKCKSTSAAHIIQSSIEHVNEFARIGLRTLMVGKRDLSKSEFHRIQEEASLLCQDPLRLNSFYTKTEEQLVLLGVTGVEDKLQDGVPQTITALQGAGIRIWMLTGDKMETALNIALTSHIIQCTCAPRCTPDETGSLACVTNLTNISSADTLTAKLLSLSEKSDTIDKPPLPKSLVIDTTTFAIGFQHCRKLFANVTMASDQIVFCRMTPLQKAQVAQLVKHGGGACRVCAVGDGGNDVAMIQQSHVAVGIFGKEGMQAARAADFAIPRFCDLQRAVLVHGSWNYERLVTLVNYFFYRAFLLTLPQVAYAFQSAFSGQAVFDATFMMFYALIFSSMPVLIYGYQERRYCEHELLTYPERYRSRRGNALMNWKWMVYYTFMFSWHAAIVLSLPTLIWGNDMELIDWATNSHLANTLVLTVTDLKLVMRTTTFTWIVLAGQVLSFGGMLLFYSLSSELFGYAGGLLGYSYFPLLMLPGFWLLCLLTTVLAILPDLIGGAIRRTKYRRRLLDNAL